MIPALKITGPESFLTYAAKKKYSSPLKSTKRQRLAESERSKWRRKRGRSTKANCKKKS